MAYAGWPLERCGATRVGEDIDPLVQKVVTAEAPKVVWMLPGQIDGAGGMFRMMFSMARKGRGAIIGDGENCIPRIHVEDCAAAYGAALEHLEALGTGERFIVADDVKGMLREFADHLAELLHAPKPKPAPRFVVKLILGKLLFETVTMHCRVTNAKAKRVLGWSPRYPSFREGLSATVEESSVATLRHDLAVAAFLCPPPGAASSGAARSGAESSGPGSRAGHVIRATRRLAGCVVCRGARGRQPDRQGWRTAVW